MKHGNWDIVYEKAIRDDGSLFFPSRLSQEFLDETKKIQGSYIFANQYQNEVIPLDEQSFKANWIRYFDTIPKTRNTFCFIDPAISQEAHADFTAVVVVHVGIDGEWYVDVAQRYKISPTAIVQKIFEVHKEFSPMIIGIEDIAYQKALLYMLDEEMRRRGVVLPVKGIRPDSKTSKQIRILGLVPRFEWSRIYLRKGLSDFESEYSQFPRAAHDDLLDALAYIEQIAVKPLRQKENYDKELPPQHPDYERQYIRNLSKSRERFDSDL